MEKQWRQVVDLLSIMCISFHLESSFLFTGKCKWRRNDIKSRIRNERRGNSERKRTDVLVEVGMEDRVETQNAVSRPNGRISTGRREMSSRDGESLDIGSDRYIPRLHGVSLYVAPVEK